MWLSGLGDDTTPDATQNSYVSLAANLVDMLHPYKQGVPVNVTIDSQTQSFLMMGGLFLGGLMMLNLISTVKHR
jgi:hypothetical protein